MKPILKAVALACMPTVAVAEPVIVPSAGSVPETVERLTASVEEAGAKIFGVVDFGAEVRSMGQDVGDLQLVIFGISMIGALALSADPMAALDLPAKVLIYDTGNGSAMAYEVPADMLAEWDIPPDARVLGVMAETLDQITSAAAE